jgi:hypothetical protein
MKSTFFLSKGAIALWSPSLGANVFKEFKKYNVCVGDVGFFTREGGFWVLFNIFLPVQANIDLGFDPPPELEPYGSVACSEEISFFNEIPRTSYRHCDGVFTQDLEDTLGSQRFDWPSSQCARSLMSFRTCFASYHLQFPATVKGKKLQRWGSVLDLPYGTWKDEMHPRIIPAVHAYLKQHAKTWYLYYRTQPTTIPNGSLKVVTTSYKCRTWALATCSTESSDEVFARLYKTSNSDLYYDWKKHDKVDVKTGPLASETQGDEVPQCIAIEVCSFEVSKNIRNTTANLTSSFIQSVSNLSLGIGSITNKPRVRR